MAKRPTKTPDRPAGPETIIEEPMGEALSRRYLAYALSTITARALPDIRDGLKPVHRRILYAMRQMRLGSGGSYRKSAKVAGQVMGDYHPHGDQAIYDAMVRLVQDFSVRIPLIDGQGNFGNIDGDNAAAMRYTECRLTEAAELLLEGIDNDTVDFRETYDGEGREPVVLPAAFPHLLANGSSGIAVGMATNIPPHNVAELIDACLHLIKTPNARTETLLNYVKGPDLPTGGVCIESKDDLAEAYATGRGGFRIRARWETEDLGRGRYQIVVTEIPYQVQKSKLVERIADLIQTKKLPVLTDVRDESAEDIRLVLEPKAGSLDPETVMAAIFKLTDLETRLSLNLNVIGADGAPGVFGLRDCLQAFLDHRRDVLLRGTRYRLDKIAHRLEILDGFLIAYLNLDEVIRIIRYEDDPKAELMATFDLSEIQTEAILNMRLRSLRKLEEMELKREHKDLKAEQKDLQALLKSEDIQWERIAGQLKETRKSFDPRSDLGRRRTALSDAPITEEVDLDELIEKEPVTVVISEKGWVRALKGHVEDKASIKYKDGDQGRFVLPAMTTDKVILVSTNGRFFALDVKDLPGGRGHGEPFRLMVDLTNEHDLIDVFLYQGDRTLLLASSAGHGLFVPEEDVLATTRKGKQVLNVAAGAEAQVCRLLTAAPGPNDYLATIGSNRKLLIFPAGDVPVMVKGKGVVLQKITNGTLVDAKCFSPEEGLTWTDRAGRQQSAEEWKEWVGKRAQAGKLPPKGFPRANRFG
ncbi:DNA topoisomerase IV subunit A [Parvularcula bermudensis HTCC2503]|uniref:DNA topoisomerase 4 subunit A n=1 Tax=Parvularcula bermudensis (strain ATCC BAA-594 / HTCC2503 / KCTC 12087) TaxID=314260 RepID=E0TD83_PARBH|nr:DNA topoisomerase IV subunit A [Parvularcula bermudensis]ADM09906.1 DNA topoisomerase IV subunit A [Parvularcula bermudensis HTCC2503]